MAKGEAAVQEQAPAQQYEDPDPIVHQQNLEAHRLQQKLKGVENEMIDLLTSVENRAAMGGFDQQSCARWCALARTHAETALMYVEKAIAAPSGGIGVRR